MEGPLGAEALHALLKRLAPRSLKPGLTASEMQRVEETFGFRFPPDLAGLLRIALPVSDKFPDWRGGSKAELQESLRWPLEGILIDVERGLWHEKWPGRPSSELEARASAKRAIEDQPLLIPVYGHRYIPAEPHEPGNPIFSVWQSDIIYYGRDLADYFMHEFNQQRPGSWTIKDPKPIRFWSDTVQESNGWTRNRERSKS